MPELDPSLVEVYTFRRTSAGVEFLLLKRRPDDFMGDTWHPVSGGIEPGETATAAAVRELFEESGLRPERLWNVNTVNAFYVAQYDRVFFTIAFVAEVTSDVPVTLSVEHTAARWVAADALPTELFWPGQQQHAHEILTHILAPSRIEPHLRIAAF